MNRPDWRAERALAEAVARRAGRIVRRGAVDRSSWAARQKGVVDLVTEVDLAAEACIREDLARLSPGVPVLAEEGGGASEAATRWIVDPLDGTTNFVHGFPAYAVSVALQVDGQIVAGCIYDAANDRAWTAARGWGARCDGMPIHVSDTADLEDALLLTGFPYDRRERAGHYLRHFESFLKRTQGLRRAGAASLDFAHLAVGHADGYWEFGLKPWDVAAGILLVEEAGGRVTDVALGPLDLEHPRLLASNGIVHEAMAGVLRSLLFF